ncbi:Zn-ribbon domain-containing OB-fold protein [Nocardioides terrisoli]|uniref:Zn-ribbon domain-containing OB-fold protein n=1 Tax=Nocardioides terrisoli TaxID=3388267 RepID=UPI00287B5E2D|nr:Zn-ribbon domain-containing OB-fold protein [Nocardioides marmorisolisilvae]
MTQTQALHARMQVDFDYTRSLGPVLSRFMTALTQHQILGGVLSDGRVVVPPLEYDPTTHDQINELVPVASEGVVETWSWVPEPMDGQPLDHPFAFALVRLDGTDAALLHAVDVPSPDDIRSGMRVRARWRPEPQGRITDIVCFEPADRRADGDAAAAASGDDVTVTTTPVRLGYDYAASPEESAFGRGLKEGRILAQACPVCHKVYVPPKGACPVDGVPTDEPHELPDTGIVTTFCIVNVPFLGQKIQPPYVSAYVLLDGADIAFLHLILGCDAADVRMGMRVKAVWKPEDERTYSLENISHFEPTGEPDADFDTYRKHL